MRLVINGYDIDQSKKDKIKYSIQANTISNLTTRQSNYTPSFTLPKTASNVKAMNNLSLVGNSSNIPYQKNNALLYADTGETIIYNGWAIIKETRKGYRCYIYDGNIDFYKSIENKTLTDIGLEELNHLKNIDSVVGTWTDTSLPYRYNIADYNGKSVYNIDKINIDYLIPSANVKYLWDKIFEYIGWTYEGSAFDLETFKSLWLTYPKTISSETQVTIPITTFNWNDNINYGNVLDIIEHNSLTACTGCAQLDSEYAIGNIIQLNILGNQTNVFNSSITALQDGLYKFTFSGTIANSVGSSTTIDMLQGSGSTLNIENIGTVDYGEPFEIVFYKNLDAGESFSLILNLISFNGAHGDVDIDFEIVQGNTVDFEEAFISFSLTDFVREVLVRLGITPFTDIRNKNVEFLTIDEIVQNQEVDDWTDKYQGKIGESYVYGKYGRKNRFSYKYNDKDASYNDGYLNIDNINLRDEVTAFKSKVYSPEKNKTGILFRNYNVYKFWNKEVKDDGSLNYKPLENRFYFMKSIVIQGAINVGSDEYQSDQIASVYAVEDFYQLNWTSILNSLYPAINAIVNKSKIFKTLINLNNIDIKNIDLKKLVYIGQEASYFLKNKITNWKENDPNTNVQLIKLDLSSVDDVIVVLNPQILINSSISVPSPPFGFTYGIRTDYVFLDYTPVSATITMKQLDASPDDGGVVTGFEYTNSVSVVTTSLTQTLPSSAPFNYGWYEVQIVDQDGLESNIEHVYFYDPAIGNPSIEISVVALGQYIFEAHNRDVQYKFNNFSPSNATLTIQANDFYTGPYGPITSIVLSNLSADTLHTELDVLFPDANGWYEVKIITNIITYTQNWFPS